MTVAEGKIAVVTGANNGIGLETALGLARAGALVVMACRNRERAEAARSDLLQRAPGAALEIIDVDLGEFDTVRSFAERFRATHDRLDLLINNAGILLYTARTNSAGIELQFATNHLGHFLLAAELIDLMPDTPASRIVSVSSVAHRGASIHFEDLTCDDNGGRAYGQSKLACLMFGDELNRRLRAAGRSLTSLSVHPGGSDSGLFDEMARTQYAVLKLLSPLITHSNASAAKPSLHAALSPDVTGGDYYGPTGFRELRGRVGPAQRDPSAQDTDVAARLWELSEQLTGRPFPL